MRWLSPLCLLQLCLSPLCLAAVVGCSSERAVESGSTGALAPASASSGPGHAVPDGASAGQPSVTPTATAGASASVSTHPEAVPAAGAGGSGSTPTPTVVTTGANGGSAAGSTDATSSGRDETSAASTSGGAASDEGTSASTEGGSESGTNTSGEGGSGAQDEDPQPPRPLNVTAPPERHEHHFRASAADAMVSYNDNDQIAIFDNRAPTLMGKLVLTFGGAGETKGNLTGGGEFCARRGFHVLAVAAFQAYNIVIHGPDFYGDARRTVFEGVMHTREDAFANIELTLADGVARRTQKALEYLHAMYPGEDWGYYLEEDGSVRWSDVIFTGVSHGASNSARFASLVRASRVVSIAGPRDNLCARVDTNDCGGEVATWLNEVPKTPLDRFYAITGAQDDQHTQHLFAMEKFGYVGEPMRIDGAQPPYGGSHRLVSGAGHDDFCAQPAYQNACNYVFGVPSENHAGTGP